VKAPGVPADNLKELGRILTSDPDPIRRGLAAVALRDKGRESLPVLSELRDALKDSDVSVRMMSANALAAIGKEASPAVPALIAAGSVQGEQVHVLRSVAAALGAIGKPAATPALPLLRELSRIPRVHWTAESAIRRIE
jgi:HEAT repeat protein